MKKQFNLNTLILTFFITIICFFLLSFSFHLESYIPYGDEIDDTYRGFGFPFIWLTDNKATSLNTFFNPVYFAIDFLIYYIAIFFLTVCGLRLFSVEKFRLKKNKLFTLIVLASIVVLALSYIYTFLFAEIDFTHEKAIYKTIRLHLGLPGYWADRFI